MSTTSSKTARAANALKVRLIQGNHEIRTGLHGGTLGDGTAREPRASDERERESGAPHARAYMRSLRAASGESSAQR